MSKTLLILITILVCLPSSITDAQQTQATTPAPAPNEVKQADTPAPTPTVILPKTEHVFVIVTDSKPDQIIVLDDKGKWISNVREVRLAMNLGSPAQCTCTMWDGFFRPTTPLEQKWPLKQLKSVTATEFQGMIDKLQSDHNAAAKQ